MKMKINLYSALLICLFVGGIVSCTKKNVVNEWTINFESIPQRLTPEESNINIVGYLIKQTHIPMFYEVQPNQFASRILKSWERAVDNKTFTLCANPKLKFDMAHSFTGENIIESLKRLTKDFKISPTVISQQNCVTVKSIVPIPNLLRILTDIRYAPSIRCNERWDCGLGPFKVTEISINKIILNRKNALTNPKQFSSIVLAHSKLLVDKQITDINRSIDARPSWIRLREYEAYNLNLLQTIILILNISDRDVRRAIFTCINPEKLKYAFNPQLLPEQGVSIPTILPLEVYSAPNSHVQECKSGNTPKREFSFVNWRANNKVTIAAYLKDLSDSSNVVLRSFEITPTEFVEELLGRKSAFRKFDLIPMAIGAEAGNYSSFFRPLVAPGKKYVSYDVENGADIYGKLVASNDKGEALSLARKLADIVSNNYMAVPLYQVNRTFYYPKNIRNLETGSNFLEYPEVGNLEVN